MDIFKTESARNEDWRVRVEAEFLQATSVFCMSRSLLSMFFLIRVFAFAVVVAVVVALHRVCIRTLMSRMNLDSVPVGVREESRCCDLSDGLGRPKRRRSHRNAVSMQRVNSMRSAERTGCTVAAWSKGDGAGRPACEPPPRQTCSSPAYRRVLRDEAPTVGALNLDRVVSGYGWRTRSADFEDTRCQP